MYPIGKLAFLVRAESQSLNNSLCVSCDNHFLVSCNKLNADF